MRNLNPLDQLLIQINNAFDTVANSVKAERPSPATHLPDSPLNTTEARHSAGLMRVNHVGEVCAQALYQGQAWVSSNPKNRAMLLQSATEELDHLAWTEQRITELDSHTSYLNPLWYTGAFTLGLIAGKISEASSLGFVIETELQVAAHLDRHLNGRLPLPEADLRSRAIVAQMKEEELEHAEHARAIGGIELPNAVKLAMAVMAKVMTTTAYRI